MISLSLFLPNRGWSAGELMSAVGDWRAGLEGGQRHQMLDHQRVGKAARGGDPTADGRAKSPEIDSMRTTDEEVLIVKFG
jgi:hypothetical protein